MQAGGSKYELRGASAFSALLMYLARIFLGNSWHSIFQGKYWISKDLHSALICLCWLKEEQRGGSNVLQFWSLPEGWPEDYKLLEKKYKIKISHFGAIPRLTLFPCCFECFFFFFFNSFRCSYSLLYISHTKYCWLQKLYKWQHLKWENAESSLSLLLKSPKLCSPGER